MDPEILLRSPLFHGLEGEELEAILSGIPNKTRKYRAGSIIANSGEPVLDFLIVTKGVVKGEMVDYAGRVIKIEDIPAPGALASAFIFGNKNKFPVNVVAVTDVELLVIERKSFLKLLRVNDKVLVNFLDIISNRSQFLSEKIKFLNFKTIRGKLAQYILNLQAGGQTQIRLDRTQSDLADFFGVARPSVARALGEMEDEGMIRADGKHIVIVNIGKLKDLTTD